MAEYIDREALHEIFEDKMQDDNKMCPIIKVLSVLEIIEHQPAADVQEVKHGKWLEGGSTYSHRCSICEHTAFYSLSGKLCNYCPCCGAKMDGVKNEHS